MPVVGLAALCVDVSTLVGGVGLLVELVALVDLGGFEFSGALKVSSKTELSGTPSC